MPAHQDQERPTAGEQVRHWLVVISLTLLGLLVAELPVLSHTRDQVYLWLQERLVRSHKSVIVVAIDDDEFWRGEPGGTRPLDRRYLASLLRTVAAADPAVIGLDVGLETNTPDAPPQWERLTTAEQELLTTANTVAQTCPLVLPRTISGTQQLVRRHDLFDAITFSDGALVTYGHTCSARDPRQIPTRAILHDTEILDSFAIAVLRNAMREMPATLDDPHGPWPYSFFLPNATFAPKGAPVGPDGLLTARAVRSASPAQVTKWLKGQVVLIGGTWRATPHGGEFVDTHHTPIGNRPGVVVHANYVQSLLWDAMYALPRVWRVSLEILLALAISIVFLRAHGWRRLALVIGTLIVVVFFTWVSNAAVGIFFDMVVPLAFVGVHALWEGGSEQFRFEFRQKFQYAEHVFTGAAVLAVLTTGFFFVRHERHAIEQELATEHRLQVTDLAPPFVPSSAPPHQQPVLATNDAREEPVVAERATPRPNEPTQHSAEPPKRLVEESQPEPPILPEHPVPLLDNERLRQQVADARPHDQQVIPDEKQPAAVAPVVAPSDKQPRVRLVDTHKAGYRFLFRTADASTITVAIDHDAQVTTPTQLIAFAEPMGKCAEEFTDALQAKFAASGVAVIERSVLTQLGNERRLSLASGGIDSKAAAKIGRIIGPGSLVFVKVHECTSARTMEHRYTAGLTGSSKRVPTVSGAMKASLQIVNLTTGVMSAARVIDAKASMSADEVDESRLSKMKAAAVSSIKGAMKYDEYPAEEEMQTILFANAVEQAHRLFFNWTETTQFAFFDDAECALRSAFEQLEKGDIAGATRAAQASIDRCKGLRPLQPAILARAYYNRGIAHFLAGNDVAALADLGQAQSLESNKVFADAILTWSRTWTIDHPTSSGQRISTAAGKRETAKVRTNPDERLRRLDDLHKKKLITDEEYERKRKEILAEE